MLPGYGYASVEPLTAVLDPVVRQWRLGATMFTIFGALALVLAAVGLYGVIAYDVAQRMREMGLRVALGAQAADIRRLVVWQGLRVTALGVTLGVIVAFVTVRYVEKLLFDTPAHDPLAFGAAVGDDTGGRRVRVAHSGETSDESRSCGRVANGIGREASDGKAG